MINTVNNPLIEESFLASKFLDPEYLFNQGSHLLSYLFTFKTIQVINVILAILCIFFIAVIIFSVIRIFEVRKKEHTHLHHEIAEYAHYQKELAEKKVKNLFKNERWVKVIEYLNSANEADWKLAVIEADSMLENLMNQLGFQGENLGEKLKNLDQERFRFLSSAWEAHIVRNKIAHEGSSFTLPIREAQRIISLYEEIFREFDYI